MWKHYGKKSFMYQVMKRDNRQTALIDKELFA